MGQSFYSLSHYPGGLLTSIALLMVGSQFTTSSKIDMIQFLSLSFDSPAKWFFLGIIFYLIFIVAIAVTAVFYIQLEINLAKKISGFVNILAWIHLLGMNIERSSRTILMIFAGLAGSGILSVFTEGNIGQQNIEI